MKTTLYLPWNLPSIVETCNHLNQTPKITSHFWSLWDLDVWDILGTHIVTWLATDPNSQRSVEPRGPKNPHRHSHRNHLLHRWLPEDWAGELLLQQLNHRLNNPWRNERLARCFGAAWCARWMPWTQLFQAPQRLARLPAATCLATLATGANGSIGEKRDPGPCDIWWYIVINGYIWWVVVTDGNIG